MVAHSLSQTTHWSNGLRTPHNGYRLTSPAIDRIFENVNYHDNVNVPLSQSEIFSDGPDGARKWLFKRPWDLLRMPLRDTCCVIEKMCVDQTNFSAINDGYGDNWGSKANYVVVPTSFVYGLNGVMRLIPTIPPSRNGTASCMILYGVLAPYQMEPSHYCWDINRGLDPDLICADPIEGRQITNDVNLYVRAVCELAHARGIKIGFSMRTSSEQMWFGDGDNNERFCWNNDRHFDAYVHAAKNLVDLGMDAIYLDCAFLSGHGGQWIPLNRLHDFTRAIHCETARGHQVAILGEGCDRNWQHWKNLGLTAGFHEDVTAGLDPYAIRRIAEEQAHNDQYRSGWHTRVDNDFGTSDYTIRTGVSRALTLQEGVSKVPGMVSLTDMYMLHDTNIHTAIEKGLRWDRHWCNHGYFQNTDASYRHQLQMNDIYLQGALQWE
jgi:hypothetical protein